jgi:DegV family protein with EDD domain
MVKIVTDSTADLTKEIIEEYGIEIVPLTVNLGKMLFRDYYDMTPKDFFQMLKETDDFPTTSQPSVDEFLKTYTKIGNKDDIVSVHISLGMSKTAQSASTAQKQLSGYKINIIDSRTVSAGLGLIVLELAKAVKDGADIKEVLSLADDLKSKIKIYFSVENLDHLQKGGRIGKAQGFLGTMLKIKPLLAVADGVVTPVERIRGSSRLISRMVEIIKDDAKGKKMKVAFIFGEDESNSEELISQLKSEIQFEEMFRTYTGTVITSHAGPTAFGLAYYLSSF